MRWSLGVARRREAEEAIRRSSSPEGGRGGGPRSSSSKGGRGGSHWRHPSPGEGEVKEVVTGLRRW
jgi:hypothetical protein